MSESSNLLQIHINGQQTFFVSERILSNYSLKLRKLIKQEKRKTQIRNSGIEIDDFPGGADGFELVSRFCYNNGGISISVSNVSQLHCCAVFLGMTEKASSVNLLHQTEVFLEGIFYWSWSEILTCLKNCESFFSCAESCGLIEKLMCPLLAKIAQNADVNHLSLSSSSSSSSPETGRFVSPPNVCNNASNRKASAWWFQALAVLSPKIIEYFLRSLGAYGSDNNNLVVTRFLLHYLKTALHANGSKINVSTEYNILADTMVNGVVSIGKTAFSCRGLFWVLRVVSHFGLSRERRNALEKLIGEMLDQATLDDLLISGGGNGGVYDVNLVLRLIRLFVQYNDKLYLHKIKKVGRLIDMYLKEIGPDPNLKISKFLGVAESLPDSARESFDQVYRAIDIYLEAHPSLSLEERSRLCRCLSYEKLSLETCKELATNPRIPPRVAVQALSSQTSTKPIFDVVNVEDNSSLSCSSRSRSSSSRKAGDYQLVVYKHKEEEDDRESLEENKEEMKLYLQKMQWRVVELEKMCREMKGQMSRMAKIAHPHGRFC